MSNIKATRDIKRERAVSNIASFETNVIPNMLRSGAMANCDINPVMKSEFEKNKLYLVHMLDDTNYSEIFVTTGFENVHEYYKRMFTNAYRIVSYEPKTYEVDNGWMKVHKQHAIFYSTQEQGRVVEHIILVIDVDKVMNEYKRISKEMLKEMYRNSVNHKVSGQKHRKVAELNMITNIFDSLKVRLTQ